MPKFACSLNQNAIRSVHLSAKPYHAEAGQGLVAWCRLLLRSRYSAAVVHDIERLLVTHLHSIALSSRLGDA